MFSFLQKDTFKWVPQYGHKNLRQRAGPFLILRDNAPCLQAGKYINRLRRLFRAFNFFSWFCFVACFGFVFFCFLAKN